MAQQKGIIPLTGTIGGINFYYLNGKPIARRAGGGFNGKAIKEKASMQRVRENSSEFGHCSRVNKVFRNGLRPLYMGHTFTHFHSRLMTLFTSLKDLDTFHDRGKRRVGTGAATAEGKRLLNTFGYTPHCPVPQMFPFGYDYDFDTKELLVQDIQGTQVNWMAGSDCLSVQLGILVMDYDIPKASFFGSDPVFVMPNTAMADLALSPTVMVPDAGMQLAFLGIRFYQTVNGDRYVMQGSESVGLLPVF